MFLASYQAALNIIAQQMPDEEIAQLKKVFTSMDKNGDGQLTVQEMLEGIQKSGGQIRTEGS